MPNPWGTAMQVLAGAFGGGASSLGQSRLDQSRLDTDMLREDERNMVRDKQWKQEFGLQRDELAANERHRQAQADLQREQLATLNGLTPDQYRRVRALMEARDIDFRQAMLMVMTNEGDVQGTPIANPRRPGGAPRPSAVAPPSGRPAAPRPPRPRVDP